MKDESGDRARKEALMQAQRIIDESHAAERRGELAEAVALYQEALQVLEPAPDSPLSADVRRWLGTVRREMGATSDAADWYQRSLELSERIRYAGGEAHALNCLAIIAQRRGEMESAATLYRQASRRATDAGEHRLLGMVEQNLGVLANIRGDLDSALVRYRSSLQAFTEVQDQEGMSWVLNNLGMLHTDLGRFAEAHEYFDQGLEIARGRQDVGMEGLLALNLAELHIAKKDWVAAASCCATARGIADERGDRLRAADAMKFQAVILRETGKLEAARDLLLEAALRAEGGEDALLEAELHRELGEVALRSNDPSGARGHWTRAIDLFRSIDAALDAGDLEKRLLGLADGAASAQH